MKKTVLIIMAITMISKLLGFGRDVALSYYYGASELTDVYLIALIIPETLFAFFSTAIATSYIPMYSRISSEKGVEPANRFTSNLLHIVMGIAILLVILVFTFTPEIVKLFAIGFEGETLRLAVSFTRVSVFGVFASGAIAILTGYLQINNKFIIPALIGFPLNFAIIVAIVISHQTDVIVLVLGTLGASFLQLLYILPSVHKSGYRHRMVFSVRNEHIKAMLILALPVLLGTSVNQINTLVGRTLASLIAVGGITTLNYANILSGALQGPFVSSIAVVIYPSISRMASEGRMDAFKSLVGKSVNMILLLILPASIGAMVFARPIVKLLFGNGAFDERALVMTSGAFFFYAIGMTAFGVREVLSKAFYSLQDTKTPMYNAALSVVLNIVLIIALSRFMGIPGLALATSISAIVCSGLLFLSLRKKIGSLGLKVMVISTVKILLASGIMGVAASLAFGWFNNFMSTNISLLFAILVAVIVYSLLILSLKVPEVEEMTKLVKDKLQRREV